MAVDAYMYFKDYAGNYISGESQVDLSFNTNDTLATDFVAALKVNGVFEIEDYGFGTEQTYNIGSQSTGLGAGKIKLNPFHITRKIDKCSPLMFQNSASGKSFQQVGIGCRKSAGTESSGIFYLLWTFSLVGVQTIEYSHDEESPKETINFVYGAKTMQYCQQNNDGSPGGVTQGGWNQQTNTAATYGQTSGTIGKSNAKS